MVMQPNPEQSNRILAAAGKQVMEIAKLLKAVLTKLNVIDKDSTIGTRALMEVTRLYLEEGKDEQPNSSMPPPHSNSHEAKED